MHKDAQAAVSIFGLMVVALLVLVGILRYDGTADALRAQRTAHTCKLTTTYADGHTFTVVWDDPRDCDRLNRSGRARP